MRDRSYTWLKDATSFGFISDKSAEIQRSKYWNIGQFSILAMADIELLLHVCSYANEAVMSLPVRKLHVMAVWRTSKLSNILTLIS